MSAFTRNDLSALGAILREAADTEILPRFRKLDAGDVGTKSGPYDLVTVADQAAERLITARIAERFPGAAVIGEEATSDEPSHLGRIREPGLAITIDPIDGTFNFANGLTLFGVMAGVMIDGRIVAGAIYDPFCRDHAYAIEGGGAWFEDAAGAKRPIKVADPVPLDRMHGPVSWYYLAPQDRPTVAARMPELWASYSYRCAAHEYRLLASGGCHIALYAKLMPWDHAAGWILHREAGGYSALADGSPYDPSRTTGPLLLAPDEASWRAVRDALFR